MRGSRTSGRPARRRRVSTRGSMGNGSDAPCRARPSGRRGGTGRSGTMWRARRAGATVPGACGPGRWIGRSARWGGSARGTIGIARGTRKCGSRGSPRGVVTVVSAVTPSTAPDTTRPSPRGRPSRAPDQAASAKRSSGGVTGRTHRPWVSSSEPLLLSLWVVERPPALRLRGGSARWGSYAPLQAPMEVLHSLGATYPPARIRPLA